MSTAVSTPLLILGGGPGGYGAAFLAADLGMEVVLVDTGVNPGGVCLFRGCIPSKTLLHAARVISETREAANWGLTFGEPRVDIDRLRAWKNEVVEKLTGGVGQLSKRRKVRHIRGYGRFQDAHTLRVETGDGEQAIRFEHAIVATGSRPVTLPGFPDSEHVMDSTDALDLPDVPGRLLVVGGGYIGMELGSVYAALGSRVTVVEMMDSLLPGVDADLVRPLAKRAAAAFEAVHLKTRVTEVTETAAGVDVVLQAAGGKTSRLSFDRVLVSVGRRPNSGDLGLEQAGVTVDGQGFVPVDPSRRTNIPSIYAIGDLVGPPMLAHKATHEGRVAAEAIAGRKAVFEPRAIPAVVFTDPEIAWCGLSENEAKAAGRKIEIVRFPWAASGRAATLGRSDGVTKILVDPDTRRVLGVGISGPGAGELIAEGALAVEMGATVDDLELTIHPHPTLSETLMEAAESFFGTATHIYRPKRR